MGIDVCEEKRNDMRQTLKLLIWVLAIVIVGHVILSEVIR